MTFFATHKNHPSKTFHRRSITWEYFPSYVLNGKFSDGVVGGKLESEVGRD